MVQPLTFVTSIFGMTNMPEHPASYWPFGVTLVAICIPFFSIIGFLSTKRLGDEDEAALALDATEIYIGRRQ
jgi:Mg2+ and Co2+ transporter CorA